jgi:Fe-S oxidoreductase
MIDLFIFNQRYEVPEELTILKAYEWAGFKLTHGVGCRGGFCGACGTVYRLHGDYKLRYALACQTVVQPGMILSQIPFFPAQHPSYDLNSLQADGGTLLEIYPETLTCYGCNTCTKSCPQEIDVLRYVSAALRGDLVELADTSFDCIMCGLFVARCPAEIVPPNIALLGRRLYGKFIAPTAEHLYKRVHEVEKGTFQAEMSELKALPLAELKARYSEREIEA